jgi:DNA-binding response OmpR family regulator
MIPDISLDIPFVKCIVRDVLNEEYAMTPKKTVFDFLNAREPISQSYYTYYPDTRVVINTHGKKVLTPTHAKIFHILAKTMALDLKKRVPREILHNIVFDDNNIVGQNVISMHIHHMNKALKFMNIRIKNSFTFGYYIDDLTIKDI